MTRQYHTEKVEKYAETDAKRAGCGGFGGCRDRRHDRTSGRRGGSGRTGFGGAYGWGHNGNGFPGPGAVGDGTNINRPTPVPLSALPDNV